MTTSHEALREAVERVTDFATEPNTVLFDRHVPHLKADLRALLSALQEAREALGPFAAAWGRSDRNAPYSTSPRIFPALGDFRRAAEVYRALSPGGTDE